MAGQYDSPAPPVGRRNHQRDAVAPDGSEIRLLVDDYHAARRASLCEVTLPVGQVSRPVWHQQVEEIWYVLQGSGKVWRCPKDVEPGAVVAVAVGPGDSLVIPARWRFQFSANFDADLRFLCYTSPPWPGPEEAQPSDIGALGPATV
jgi:mannose-6-phosphate isomerase-like protein (cupin superfamily)